MAGIGVKLTNIYKKNTLTTDIIGMGYSTIVTIAPMLVVIGALMIMEYFLDFSSVDYVTRELFSCTVLYIFIFSLLTASLFNSVLSKYMSDVIYEETFEDILPCYYVGMILNISLSALVGIPFCIHEFLVGKVDIIYVFTGYCGYVALVLVFYSMLYLSICKDYKKISLFFCHRYDSYSTVIISAGKDISLEHYIWNAFFTDSGLLADSVSGNVCSEKLF